LKVGIDEEQEVEVKREDEGEEIEEGIDGDEKDEREETKALNFEIEGEEKDDDAKEVKSFGELNAKTGDEVKISFDGNTRD
jgi:hypothetical protein